MLLIIDSSQKLPGGTDTNFRIRLNPGITFNKMRLVYASICNVTGNEQPYYLVSFGSMQATVRSASANTSGMFVIPVNAVPGHRNILTAENTFVSISDGSGIHLNELEVKILHPDNSIAPDPGETNILILEL